MGSGAWRQYVQRVPMALWQVALHLLFFAAATFTAAALTAPLLLVRCLHRAMRALLWPKQAVAGRQDVIVVIGADTPLGINLVKEFISASPSSSADQSKDGASGVMVVAYGENANLMHEEFDQSPSVKVVRGLRLPSATDAERLHAVVSQSSRYLLAVVMVPTVRTPAAYTPPKSAVAMLEEICSHDAALEASAVLTLSGMLTPLLLSASNARNVSYCSAAPRLCLVSPAPTTQYRRAADELCSAAVRMVASRLSSTAVYFSVIKVTSSAVPAAQVRAAVLDLFPQDEMRLVVSPLSKLASAARALEWARIGVPESWGLRRAVRRALSRMK